MGEVPTPMNTTEQYLHAMVMRLDALCHMMSDFNRAYAEQNNIATTHNTVEEKPAPKRRKKVAE